MNFPHFVSFPTERRHPSAVAAHLGWGERTVRRGDGRERGRRHFLSGAATSRGPRRMPRHLPPLPTNSSMQEGTVLPTPLLSNDDDDDDDNNNNNALVSPLPPLPSLESRRNRGGGTVMAWERRKVEGWW
jgi:hypothetical protein